MADHLHTLDGVEIFAAGVHNGDKYTEADLDEMVKAFNSLDYKPPLKQGHMKDSPGMPALGYVDQLKRVGSKLVARFSDIPGAVMDALQRRSYNRVSAEVYFNLDRGGNFYKRALKAVALLGAEIPAVAGLAPLSSLFSEIESEVKTYDFDMGNEEEKAMTDKVAADVTALQSQIKAYEEKLTLSALESEQLKKTVGDLTGKLDSITKNYEEISKEQRKAQVAAKVEACTIPAFHEHLTGLYEIALDTPITRVYAVGGKELQPVALLDKMVADINAKASALFKEYGHSDTSRKKGDESDDPAVEVDRLTREYQQQHAGKSYNESMKIVLASNPELKQRYAAVQS